MRSELAWAYPGQCRRANLALSLWLTVDRNPSITTTELLALLGTDQRGLQHRAATARSAGLPLWCQSADTKVSSPREWYTTGPAPKRTGAEPVLCRWIDALQAGSLDLTEVENPEKMKWYKEVSLLMLVGTPPWSPTDYIDVLVKRKTLTFTVPSGRSINHPEIRTVRSRARV